MLSAEEGVIGPKYLGSNRFVAAGDNIVLDGVYFGTVEQVLLPGTEDARRYACEATGGVLLLLDVSGLTLELFGTAGILEFVDNTKNSG